MTTSPRHHQSGYSLRTLGAVALRDRDSSATSKLRKKDLALLVYLCIEGGGPRSRLFLSSLLWGDRPQGRARHSLTQAVGRLRSIVGDDSLVPRSQHIHWLGSLTCDAAALERAYAGDASAAAESMYGGDFLADFQPGSGAEEFNAWADARRMRYRSMALHVFETLGTRAENAGNWAEALELGRRAVDIEGLYEAGHRRIMRAFAALGERGLALHHYSELAIWLQQRVSLPPDPATTQLAEELRRGLVAPRDHGAAVGVDAPSNGGSPIPDRSAPPRDEPGRDGVLSRVARAFRHRTAFWTEASRK